jgi:hypothetical protein
MTFVGFIEGVLVVKNAASEYFACMWDMNVVN